MARLIWVLVFFSACAKNQPTIDVSQQDKYDYSGNHISGPNDGQWATKTFSSQEQSLFKQLDTVDLSGTLAPDSAIPSSVMLFPNPFNIIPQIRFEFPGIFTGQMVLKYVIVDSHLNIQYAGAFKISVTPEAGNGFSFSAPAEVTQNLSVGEYRIYFSLSAAAKPDFFKSWGNIQKTT